MVDIRQEQSTEPYVADTERSAPSRTAPRLTVSVIIPTLDEETNIGWVLAELPDFVTQVVIVDGRSRDRTVELSRAARPDVVVLDEPRPGKGVALRSGIAAATGDYVVTLDADGSMAPGEIGRFLRLIDNGFDLVKGSRFMAGGTSSDITPVRRIGNGFLVGFVNLLFGSSFTDLCYGFCAFRRESISDLDLRADGFEIETEMALRAVKRGLSVTEVASSELARRSGVSHLRVVRDGMRVMRTVLRERLTPAANRRRRAKEPASDAPTPPKVGTTTPRVCVVGPSARFLSGITYYTFGLVEALAEECDVSALFMRRLLPRSLYPGRARVGQKLTGLRVPPSVPAYDGVDWSWGPSLVGGLRFLRARQPDVVVLQWWTASVLHSYLALARAARRRGAKILVEFHEVLDVGESQRRWVACYARLVAPRLFRVASACIVHSEHDRELVCDAYGLSPELVRVVPHPAFSFPGSNGPDIRSSNGSHRECHLLYFGVIRPFKGVEDLLSAFALLSDTEVRDYRLTVVGETWEDWTLPAQRIADHPHRERITFVNRYVTDAEAHTHFAEADLVVLPYRRSSQSGPLHVAMAYGLPVVTTKVGGLVEAAGAYAGSVLVDPAAPLALLSGIKTGRRLRGQHFEVSTDWPATAKAYLALISETSARPVEVDSETPA
ncbi:MAG TPA: glycosyltransferase [Acidimicrobiales bacterium]|nr:glycosyltransferase [Acidimicrobiales bacterium]